MKANTMAMAMAILLMATGSLALGLAACGGGDIPDDVEWEVKDHEKFTALEIRPESQLAGFSTAHERRNTVVNDMFVHATRFNHP